MPNNVQQSGHTKVKELNSALCDLCVSIQLSGLLRSLQLMDFDFSKTLLHQISKLNHEL
jgi:hypothetical protein